MISWLGYNAGGSQIAANVLNVTYERCDCPGLQLFSIYGRGKFYYSTLRDAPNWYGSTAANNDGLLKADWIADHCSLTGGGLDADAVHTHFEPCQHNSNGLYQLVDSIFDLSNCQDVWPYTDPDTGWTAGIVSVTDAGGSGIAQAEILRSILIGIRANNKLGRSKIGQPIAMSEGGAAGTTVKDSVLEPGVFGYAVNNSPGGTTKATDLGGNRDWLTNVVVNVAA